MNLLVRYCIFVLVFVLYTTAEELMTLTLLDSLYLIFATKNKNHESRICAQINKKAKNTERSSVEDQMRKNLS